ncbi:MAG TPA: hypothetical protein VGN08_10565 [Solirubrobacteraceae bacterium]
MISLRRRVRWALCVAALATTTLALALAGQLPGQGASSRALAQTATGEPQPQDDASVPVPRVTMIGSSPLEAGNETWGVGEQASAGSPFPSVLVRYTSQEGWTLGPALLDSAGQPLQRFRLFTPEGGQPSPLAGEMTPAGGGVLAGTVPGDQESEQACTPHAQPVVLVRSPGGAFQETAPLPPEGEAALTPGEHLLCTKRAPLIAPLDEGGGHAGALIVPVREPGKVESSVLHWDGSTWRREPIEVPAASASDFRVLAIGAGSPSNAWLLAQLSSEPGAYPAGSVALFRRAVGGEHGAAWRPVALSAGEGDGQAHPLVVKGQLFSVAGLGEPPKIASQLLTVTSEGVWVDGKRNDIQASTTMFFKPEGGAGGHVVASWCTVPAGSPPGTPACDEELPEPLPTGPSRSIAWANPSTPEGLGERVITGFPDGVSLRLDGRSFTRVLALGGGEDDVGGTFGAAFSNPREGWLGQERLPVHLTLNPSPSRLSTWPVAFHHSLVAIAPQPGVPIGALSSEALAVGDQGEVARYQPGKGWMPESLFGTGGRIAKPRLRAVAWPTPTRAYSVGDLGEMWLWRGETGLWEPDPATPYNFRGNLLGIAFDPTNPARGYAVGSSGVLLSYGKTWTQEALPPAAAGADLTSIAFAGSEAIVAYRKRVDPNSSVFAGGLLLNDGSGWRVDEAAAAAIGGGTAGVVAGLADGGAAFTRESTTEAPQVFERQNAGAPWQPVATPFPGGGSPGSLALFREGGALRAIAAGSLGGVETPPPSPPGLPPPLVPPYGLGANPERALLRQTATGWSDEQHELNNVREPPGHYRFYDTVFEPDPISTVLVDPTGTQGWAVGGFVDNESHGILDTADVERYPADGSTPPGIASSPVPTDGSQATFAIAGGAQCSAPCADQSNAAIGPQVWLSAALARAGQIPGVRAFLYTGPGVTAGEVSVRTLPIPYRRELGRYASLLASSPLPPYASIGPTELDETQTEAGFEQAFGGFREPFGRVAPAPGEPTPAGPNAAACSTPAGCQSPYYAVDSTGSAGTVRVIVLDDSTDVGEPQLGWLAEELSAAKAGGEPAIVVGQADLNAQIGAGDGAAAAVARTIVGGGASAYFYDSPEQNVTFPLRSGGESIPTFGSGTLGYVNANAETTGAFLGASGFLLAQVDFAKPLGNNRVAVSARLIPSIGELAMEAKDGTLLRRSQPALFAGLARRPRAGNRSRNSAHVREVDPYIPIPSICRSALCANGLFPEYTFSSSRPQVGDFVKQNLALVEGEPHAVLHGPEGKPIHDEHSELFCAYNAGTTIVTITAGGLSSSLPVTVQAGSVRQPCGTTPLTELPPVEQSSPAPVPPAPAPAPAGSSPPPSATPPLVPVPPIPAAAPVPPPARVTPALPFFLTPAPATPLLAAVPPPVPTPARPTPPSGTSAVTSPVEAPEREEEEEEATESVGNQASAYRSAEHEMPAGYILGIVLLAALAGASVKRRPRRGRRDVRVAPATLSTMRSQRRMSARRRWP